MKKAAASLARSGIMAELLPALNREDKATSTGVGPRKKYKVGNEFTRERQSEGMNPIVKSKEDARERKLPRGPVGIGATSVVEVGAVGIAMSTAVLGFAGMSVAKKIEVRNI